jgi:hypothetical protein
MTHFPELTVSLQINLYFICIRTDTDSSSMSQSSYSRLKVGSSPRVLITQGAQGPSAGATGPGSDGLRVDPARGAEHRDQALLFVTVKAGTSEAEGRKSGKSAIRSLRGSRPRQVACHAEGYGVAIEKCLVPRLCPARSETRVPWSPHLLRHIALGQAAAVTDLSQAMSPHFGASSSCLPAATASSPPARSTCPARFPTIVRSSPSSLL